METDFNYNASNEFKEKVVAITVTFNRTKTLKKTIAALLNQNYHLYKIIIVDNNSRIEEKEIINKLALLSPNIDIVWLNENLGGAGGFEAGMRKALKEYQPDWYWLMDDDAYPTPSCLMTLLNYKDKLENIGCLAPAIYGIDNKEYQMYHHKIITKYKMVDSMVAKHYSNLKDVTKITANAFVGPLFNKKAIETLGIADGGLFIYGDDTEYTFRVSRKYNIYLIKNSIIEHQDPSAANKLISPGSWWKEYYDIRNRFLFINEFQTNLFKRTFAEIYLFKVLLSRIKNTLLEPNYNGYKKLRIKLLMTAYKDGMLGKKGKTIDPVDYSQKIKKIINER